MNRIKKRILLLLAAVLLVYAAYLMKQQGPEEEETFRFSEESENGTQETAEQTRTAMILVHISGAVVSPGVYRLDENARVFHLIEAAGGLLDDADGGAVNQAAYVHDGEHIVIPRITAEGTAEAPVFDLRVDINAAAKEELMSLPGIGEAKAEAILEYRKKNGPFREPEALMNVSGIGEALYGRLRDKIRI